MDTKRKIKAQARIHRYGDRFAIDIRWPALAPNSKQHCYSALGRSTERGARQTAVRFAQRNSLKLIWEKCDDD